MFGIDSSELLLIAIVALVVIGPKELPRAMRVVGGWVGRGRAMTRHLRSGFDAMMREAELEEMQKQWAKQNADIMAATQPAPIPPDAYDPAPYAPDDAPPMTAPQPAADLPAADLPATEPAIPLEPQPDAAPVATLEPAQGQRA